MLMDSRTRKLSWGLVVVAVACVISTGEAQDYTSVVPAVIAFGDSAVSGLTIHPPPLFSFVCFVCNQNYQTPPTTTTAPPHPTPVSLFFLKSIPLCVQQLNRIICENIIIHVQFTEIELPDAKLIGSTRR
ncbi:hypothetical protein Hanom_Chr07g00671561 [Helianthus anomalus]